MARLTDVLDSPGVGGISPIGLPARGGTFLGGLANAIGGIDTVLKDIAIGDEERRVREREQVANEFAQASWDAALQPELVRGPMPPPVSAELEGVPGPLTSQVQAGTQDLARIQMGVTQGRVSPDLYRIRLNTLREKLFAQYPEHKAYISKMFIDAGHDDVILRDINLQLARDKAVAEGDIASDVAMMQSYKKYLGDRGFNVIPMSDAEVESLAIPRIQQDYKEQQAAEVLRLANQAATSGSTGSAESKKRAEKDYYNTTINGRTQAVSDFFTALSDLAGPTAGVQGSIDLGELQGQLFTAFSKAEEQDLVRARQAGVGLDIQKAISDWWKSQRERFSRDVFNANFEQNKRAFEALKTIKGIDKYKALPYYMAYADAFGQANANEVFTNIGANPDFVKRIEREIREFDPSKPETSFNLVNANRILKGSLSLEQLSPREGAKVIKTMSPVLAGMQSRAARGELVGNESTEFYNGSLQIQNAVSSLTPDATTPTQFWRGSSLAFSRDLRLAAEKLGGTQGDELILGGRDAAATTISNLLRMRSKYQKQGYWSIVPASAGNPNGPWMLQFDQASWDKDQAAYDTMLAQSDIALPSGTRGRSSPPEPGAEQLAWVNTVNRASIFLSETAKPGKDVPEGLTMGQLRTAYGNGRPPASPVAEKTEKKDVQSREQLLRGLQEDILKFGKAADEGRKEYPLWADDDPRWIYATVFGENTNASPEEAQAIAATIINRAETRGKSFRDIVTEGGGSQYNVWKPGYALRDRMESLDVNTLERLQQVLDPLISGNLPPELQGLTQFYHPSGMELGPDGKRKKAPFDNGRGVRIGQGLFFR